MNTDRCLECGLRVRLHFDAKNRKLACAETKRRHPRATVRKRAFESLLAMSRRQA